MMPNLRLLCSSLLAVAVAAGANAASASRWHVEAGPSVWVRADVTWGAALAPDPSTAARTDRIYDDGFNRVDASGNVGDGAGGALPSRTGYFGFTSDSQVNLTAGTLALHQVQAANGQYIPHQHASTRVGVDLNARLSLAPVTATRDWGVEAGTDFGRFRLGSAGVESATVRLLTDTYALGGVVPQRAPYTGRFSPLPGDQRIGDIPTRAITTPAGSASGARSFRGRATMLRLGGWCELWPGAAEPRAESERWSVLAHAGPALFTTRASFNIDEQVQAAGVATTARVTSSGSRSRTDWGGFGGLKVRRTCSKACAVLAYADYVAGSKLTVPGGARFARLDLSGTYLLGLSVEFQWGNR